MKKVVLITTLFMFVPLTLLLFKIKDLDSSKIKNKESEIKSINDNITSSNAELDSKTITENELKDKNSEQIVVLEVWEKELKRLTENL